jgi:TRAP-type mannitol/chloroaromatic compound transport system permease large subunit
VKRARKFRPLSIDDEAASFTQIGILKTIALINRCMRQTGAGFDPTWLVVIAIILAEISRISPPLGLNVYVVRSASPIPVTLEDVFAGIMPFLFLDILTLGLLIAFPQITLALPNLIF